MRCRCDHQSPCSSIPLPWSVYNHLRSATRQSDPRAPNPSTRHNAILPQSIVAKALGRDADDLSEGSNQARGGRERSVTTSETHKEKIKSLVTHWLARSKSSIRNIPTDRINNLSKDLELESILRVVGADELKTKRRKEFCEPFEVEVEELIKTVRKQIKDAEELEQLRKSDEENKDLHKQIQAAVSKGLEAQGKTLEEGLGKTLEEGLGRHQQEQTKVEARFLQSLGGMEQRLGKTLDDMRLEQRAQTNALRTLLSDDYKIPKLVIMLPAGEQNKKAKAALGKLGLKSVTERFLCKKMKLYFVCEISRNVPEGAKGFDITIPSDQVQQWLKDYGPAIKVGFQCLKWCTCFAKTVGVPIDLGGLGQSVEDGISKVQQMAEVFDEFMQENEVPTGQIADWVDRAAQGQNIDLKHLPPAAMQVKQSYEQLVLLLKQDLGGLEDEKKNAAKIKANSMLIKAISNPELGEKGNVIGWVSPKYEELWKLHGDQGYLKVKAPTVGSEMIDEHAPREAKSCCTVQ